MADSHKKAFALAEAHAQQLAGEGAMAVIVGVAMPDGNYYVMHQAPVNHPLGAICLNIMTEDLAERQREGWPGAKFVGGKPIR